MVKGTLILASVGVSGHLKVAGVVHLPSVALRDVHLDFRRYNLQSQDVDWEQVSQYSFLEEFALLRETQQQVLDQPWANPVKRLTMRQHHLRKRAHEEILRLNVEICRLLTHIYDEDVDVPEKLRALREKESIYYGAAVDYWTRRKATNEHLLRRIMTIQRLEGYSGPLLPGVRKGRVVPSRREAVSQNNR